MIFCLSCCFCMMKWWRGKNYKNLNLKISQAILFLTKQNRKVPQTKSHYKKINIFLWVFCLASRKNTYLQRKCAGPMGYSTPLALQQRGVWFSNSRVVESIKSWTTHGSRAFLLFFRVFRCGGQKSPWNSAPMFILHAMFSSYLIIPPLLKVKRSWTAHEG